MVHVRVGLAADRSERGSRNELIETALLLHVPYVGGSVVRELHSGESLVESGGLRSRCWRRFAIAGAEFLLVVWGQVSGTHPTPRPPGSLIASCLGGGSCRQRHVSLRRSLRQ